MMRTTAILLTLTAPIALLFACSGGPSTDSETHWMQSCSEDADCGDGLDCLCNICTSACDDDCSSVADDASCLDTDDDCPDADAICQAECIDAGDCPDDFQCHEGTCQLEEDFQVSENESNDESGDLATLPALAFDTDCAPEENPNNWQTPCDWVLDADAFIYGTLQDVTFYDEWDDTPDTPLEECPSSTTEEAMQLTIDVDDIPRGDVDGETVDVILYRSKYSVWSPTPRCTDDAPATPDWSDHNYDDPGVGPLDIGQKLGLAVDESDAGYLYSDDMVDPLFVERGDGVYFQRGSAFGCHTLSSSDFESLSFEGFLSTIRSCRDDSDEEVGACEYTGHFPCFGDDCCSDDCSAGQGTVYDMEHQCELDVGTWACSETGLSEPAMHWMCSMNGDYAVHAQSSVMDANVPDELTPCSNLAEYEESDPDVDDFPECQ